MRLIAVVSPFDFVKILIIILLFFLTGYLSGTASLSRKWVMQPMHKVTLADYYLITATVENKRREKSTESFGASESSRAKTKTKKSEKQG